MSSKPETARPAAEVIPRDSPDEILRQLARALDFAEPNCFTLAFAKCNLPAQRRALVERLKVLCEPLGVTLLEVELDARVERLLPLLQERLAETPLAPAPPAEPSPAQTSPAEPPPAQATEGAPTGRERDAKVAIFVYGLEYSIPSTEPDSPLLAHLNLARELFRREVPCPLVLWLPDYALTLLARGAPDFWAWRSGIYEFPPEPETAERVAREAVYAEAGHVTSSLPAEAKRERLHLLARLLDDYRELGDGLRERSTQADILWKMGNLLKDLGEWAEARERYEQALTLARPLKNQRTVAGLLHQLGILAKNQGDYKAAREHYEASLAIAEELGDHTGIASTRHQFGRLAQVQGDYDSARKRYQASLAIFEELGDRANIAASRHQLGILAQDQGDYDAAREHYQASLAIKEALGDRAGISKSRHQLGMLAQAQGDYDAAREHYEASLAIKEALGDRHGIASTRGQQGSLAEVKGELERAAERYRRTLAIFEELGAPRAEMARRDLARVEARLAERTGGGE